MRRIIADRPSVVTFQRLMLQICQSLQAAHEKNIVHRDLKPENILLETDLSPILTDFGVASISDQRMDLAAKTGTAPYMSPEHQHGAKPAPTMDIFALGVIAYEWLCGERPFADKAPSTMLAFALKRRAAITKLARENSAPQWLVELVSRMISFRPSQRPQSTAEIVKLIEAER